MSTLGPNSGDKYIDICFYILDKVGMTPSRDDVVTWTDEELSDNEVELVLDMMYHHNDIVFHMPEGWEGRL